MHSFRGNVPVQFFEFFLNEAEVFEADCFYTVCARCGRVTASFEVLIPVSQCKVFVYNDTREAIALN